MVRIITLNNAVDELMKDNLISLTQIYSYKSPKFWRIEKDIHVLLSNGELITIPKGFTTDGSTVPKWLWSLFPSTGDFLLAAIIHDYLYIERPIKMSRNWADMEMLKWSNVICDKKFDNVCRYIVVLLLGWTYWRKYIKFNTKKKFG